MNDRLRQLASTPYTDHVEWARAARETSAAFGAWSKRIEATPGPLADAARELSKSAQLRRYPQQMPGSGAPSARGASLVLMAATSKSDRAAYALMFRQLAATAKAIHDMHQATNDLRRVRGISSAVIAATKVVQASAATQTTRPARMTLEALREQNPGLDEETLRTRLVAGRAREGAPVPTTRTRGGKPTEHAGPSQGPEQTNTQRGIER